MPFAWASLALQAVNTVSNVDRQTGATNNAVNAQQAAADAATRERAREFDIEQQRSENVIGHGNMARDKLAELLGLVEGPSSGALVRKYTGAELTSDPGYQFGLDQGTKSLNNSLAAKGGLYSGAAGQALQRYGQDYAGTKFNEGFNRNQAEKTLISNQLGSMAGQGQIATSQINSLGSATANNNANTLSSMGDARASGYLANANTVANGWNSLTGQAQNYFRGSGSTTLGSGVGNESSPNFVGPSSSDASYNYVNPSDFGPYLE